MNSRITAISGSGSTSIWTCPSLAKPCATRRSKDSRTQPSDFTALATSRPSASASRRAIRSIEPTSSSTTGYSSTLASFVLRAKSCRRGERVRRRSQKARSTTRPSSQSRSASPPRASKRGQCRSHEGSKTDISREPADARARRWRLHEAVRTLNSVARAHPPGRRSSVDPRRGRFSSHRDGFTPRFRLPRRLAGERVGDAARIHERNARSVTGRRAPRKPDPESARRLPRATGPWCRARDLPRDRIR